MSAELLAALVEAVLPLEVIAAQHRAKPYRELSPELIDDINRAIGIVRAALDAAALASTSIDGVSGTGLEELRAAAKSTLEAMEMDPCDCMAHRSPPGLLRAALAKDGDSRG